MGIARLDADQVSASALRSLGLSETGVDLFSSEAMAVQLRRAASFLCPATPGFLVRTVLETLEGLPGHTDDTKDQLEDLLESLVGYGDLVELSIDNFESCRTRLFLGPPAYVRRRSGACLLLGIRPDGVQLVGDELTAQIEYDSHVRLVQPSETLDELLAANGLLQLNSDQWLKAPRQADPDELIGDYDQRLQASGPSGQIVGCRVLDPATPVGFYRGRWRPPKPKESGRFVARRPKAYGADLWCYAEVTEGQVSRLIDLPIMTPLAPGADEAWRLQAAIDALAGRSQLVRYRSGTDPDQAILDFLAPLPSWAQRRLDIVGTPLLRSRGALFSYCLPAAELAEELQFLWEMLWTAVDEQPEKTPA